jgi:acetolactate synthase-1/3 small subunit
MSQQGTHHILSVLVENKPAVLSRIVGLFSRRGFNIFSLAVSPTDDDRFSRMTIVVDAESAPIEQVVRQTDKLLNVLEIKELTSGEAVERELMLATVKANADNRGQVSELASIFEAKILDVAADSLTIMVAGTPSKLDAVEELLRPFGITGLQRTGRIALPRIPRGSVAPRLAAVPESA